MTIVTLKYCLAYIIFWMLSMHMRPPLDLVRQLHTKDLDFEMVASF